MNYNNRVAISGHQGAGKNLVANMLKEYLPHMKIYPLANPAKIEYAKQLNINGRTVEEIITAVDVLKNNNAIHRKAIIDLCENEKSINPYIWIDKVIEEDNIIIPDLRFKVEVERLKQVKSKLIRIESPREVRLERRIRNNGTLSNEDHYSETDLDDYKEWDYVIMNTGSKDDLRNKVKEILKIN